MLHFHHGLVASTVASDKVAMSETAIGWPFSVAPTPRQPPHSSGPAWPKTPPLP